MSYSDINPKWNRMHRTRHDPKAFDNRIQWEIDRANQLLSTDSTLTRNMALKRAAREYGTQARRA